MRAKEFLIEASVFKKEKNQYVPGYRMAISTKSGGSSVKAIQSVISDFSKDEELVIVPANTPSTYQVSLSKGADASFKLKRPNGEVIELQGTKSAIQSSLNGLGGPIDPNAPDKQKMPNKGDTAEGLLGAAMFVKLLKRENGVIGDVDSNDLWSVFDKLTPVNDDDFMITSKDVGGATDKVWFRLKVKGFVRTALSNPALRKKMDVWAQSPINYVNSSQGTEFAEQFYKNGQPDEIGIISDGLSAQSDRKSDVYTVIRDPKTGKIAKELLPISLKAGAEQFAQHSGNSYKAMASMFGKMGIQLQGNSKDIYDGLQKDGRTEEAVYGIYTSAAKTFNNSVVTDNQEAKFIAQLANAINSWATGGMSNVQLVSFGSRGAFEVLQFNNLLPKMKLLDLVAETHWGENPKFIIKDKNQGILFHIRTYLQTKDDGTKYQRNVIEKGPLLSKISSVLSAPVNPKVKAPIKTAPNLVPKKSLGNPAAVPAKTPTKDKVQQPATEPGDQMGAELPVNPVAN
jgi:hypothetical protein